MELTFRPVLMLMAGRGLAFAATFAIPIVLARVFDQAELGTYKQLFLVFSTLVGIAQLGMAESLFYFLPRTPRRSGQYVFNAFMVLAGGGLACVVLLALAGPLVWRWFGNDALSGLSGWLGIYVFLMLPSLVLEIVWMARKRYAAAATAFGLSDVLRAILLIIPAVLSRGVPGLLFGAVVFAGLRLIASLVYLGREFGAELRPEGAALREQVAYALPFQAGVMLAVLMANLHFFVVASSVDPAVYAIYAVGCLQIPLVDLVFTPAGNVMMVRMSDAIALRRHDLVLMTWHDTTRRLALIFLPLLSLVLLTARELILVLFTEQYAASVPIFMIWSGLILFSILQTDAVLRVYAKTRTIAALYGVQVLLIIGLIVPLMSVFGLAGAALATVLATGGVKLLALARSRRSMAATLGDLLPWRSLLEIGGASAVSALFALFVKMHLAAGPLQTLVMVTVIYAATYIGLVVARGLATSEAAPALIRGVSPPTP